MQKIPTIFVRDTERPQFVTRTVTPGCEWVLAGEGIATRKFDGTNVRVTIVDGKLQLVEKRRNPTREEKALGAEPDYVVAEPDDPSNKHIMTAVNATDFTFWPNGAWSCEALGPKIQGGADGLPASLICFSRPSFVHTMRLHNVPHDFDGLSEYLKTAGIEGIVWHYDAGRMAKIKARDFGHRWPPHREETK